MTNPDIITKFWFTRGSGRLEAGRQVQWDWEMDGILLDLVADRYPGSIEYTEAAVALLTGDETWRCRKMLE